MIMVAILCTVILTTIAVTIGTQPGTGLDSANSPSTGAVGPRGRRRARRGAGGAQAAGLVRPQYLPAVARARILRAQIPRYGISAARRREML